MPKNATHGITALQVFVELAELFDRNEPVSLGILQSKIIVKLGKYLTDGRTRSVKRAIGVLSKYELIREGINKFDEKTCILNLTEENQTSFYFNVLIFLDDNSKGNCILEEMEFLFTPLVSSNADSFPFIPDTEEPFRSMYKYWAIVYGLSEYSISKFFYQMPVKLRIYQLMVWIVHKWKTQEKDQSITKVAPLFLHLCFAAANNYIHNFLEGNIVFDFKIFVNIENFLWDRFDMDRLYLKIEEMKESVTKPKF